MFLSKIKYSQFSDEARKWSLSEFELGRINLLVGKNSSGKSKSLAIINSLSLILSENVKLPFVDGIFEVSFNGNDKTYYYQLEYKNFKITKEQLFINNELFLERDSDGGGQIVTYSGKIDSAAGNPVSQVLEFKIPPDELKSNRRDSIQYPYLEDLNFWARHVRRFEFSSLLGKDRLDLLDKTKKVEFDFNLKETGRLMSTFNEGKRKHQQDFIKGIIADFNSIGYDITNVDVGNPVNVSIAVNNPSFEIIGLRVQERDLTCMTDQNDMSNGMYRALSIIVHFNFYELEKIPGCILLDDIGEGLDFDRANKLIQLLISKVEANQNIQLIMSTNDKYVMNHVDLKYWQIIDRVGSEVKYFNHKNSTKAFEEFKFTGLNNFDFFASEYFKNGFENEISK